MGKNNVVLKGGYIPSKILDIETHLQEISRGAGIHKAKKGKGSYTRKEKHKTNRF